MFALGKERFFNESSGRISTPNPSLIIPNDVFRLDVLYFSIIEIFCFLIRLIMGASYPPLDMIKGSFSKSNRRTYSFCSNGWPSGSITRYRSFTRGIVSNSRHGRTTNPISISREVNHSLISSCEPSLNVSETLGRFC